MKKYHKRIHYGDETRLQQPGRQTCADCGCKRGEYHGEGCAQEECPSCYGMLIGCSCDSLSIHDSARIIQALSMQFSDLHSALMAVGQIQGEQTERPSYLYHAAMQYLFANLPDNVKQEVTGAFQLRFPGLVPALQDENGQGYYTAEQLAKALDIPLAEVQERIEAMVAAGQGIRFADGVKLRKVH